MIESFSFQFSFLVEFQTEEHNLISRSRTNECQLKQKSLFILWLIENIFSLLILKLTKDNFKKKHNIYECNQLNARNPTKKLTKYLTNIQILFIEWKIFKL